MDTKVCIRCKSEKAVSEFHKKGRAGYSSRCKRCFALYPSQILNSQVDRTAPIRLRNRQYLWNYYKIHPCVDCGESDPIVLELDHVRGTKVMGVSKLAGNSASLVRLQAEIDKCEVRCANCHRRKTASSQSWYAGIER
jgi:hypothetical protein